MNSLLCSERTRFSVFLATVIIMCIVFSVKAGPQKSASHIMHQGEEIAHWTAEQADAFFYQDMMVSALARQAQNELASLGTAQNGIKFYRLTYKTKDVDGNLVSASGLLALPDSNHKHYPLVSYQHGTILDNSYSPSAIDHCQEAGIVSVIFAGRGYAVAMPDYIGMGSHIGFHPYLHAASEASSSADFLLAAEAFVSEMGIQFGKNIFLVGMSQGGHATMALQRLLENDTEHYGFKVAKSAPIAGPYEVTTVLKYWLEKPQWVSSPATVRLLNAYGKIYHLSCDWKTIFRQPYAAMVDSMFDGEMTMLKVAILPANLQNLFTEVYLNKINHSEGELYKRIQENAVFLDWTPNAPVHFYHGKNDAIVPFAISEGAYTLLRQRGADVRLINLGNQVGHAEALIPACIEAEKWFNELP